MRYISNFFKHTTTYVTAGPKYSCPTSHLARNVNDILLVKTIANTNTNIFVTILFTDYYI